MGRWKRVGTRLAVGSSIADINRAAPSPIVFPQIADGGGYVTQFILISPGGASSTQLNFYGETGAPLAVGK